MKKKYEFLWGETLINCNGARISIELVQKLQLEMKA